MDKFLWPRSAFESFVLEKSLQFVSTHKNSEALDYLLASGDVDLPLRNVCAKVTPQLADKIDEVVDLLGVSKRRFLEAAFIEAVSSALQIMEREGVFEMLENPEGDQRD